MELVRQRVDGVWTPNFENILQDYGGESGEARSADCSMHPSDRYTFRIHFFSTIESDQITSTVSYLSQFQRPELHELRLLERAGHHGQRGQQQ